MTLDEIKKIKSCDILDLDDFETGYEIINIIEDLAIGEKFIIGLECRSKKYDLLIDGEKWELFMEKDFHDIPFWHTPDREGNILTLKYRENNKI